MSTITVSTAFNIDLEFHVAPFHKRLLAYMVDLVVIIAYIYGTTTVLEPLINSSEVIGETAFFIIILIPVFCYHLVLEVLWNGRTLGKKVLGIKVMDKEGNKPSLSQYALRWVMRLVDITITMGVGAILSIALSNLSQRLGDMVAGTIVVDERSRTNLHETIYLEIEDEQYQPKFPQVMKLTDRDINGIRNLLNVRGSSKDTEIYMAQVAHRIKEVLQVQTELEPREMLETLLQDYNFLTRK